MIIIQQEKRHWMTKKEMEELHRIVKLLTYRNLLNQEKEDVKEESIISQLKKLVTDMAK